MDQTTESARIRLFKICTGSVVLSFSVVRFQTIQSLYDGLIVLRPLYDLYPCIEEDFRIGPVGGAVNGLLAKVKNVYGRIGIFVVLSQ